MTADARTHLTRLRFTPASIVEGDEYVDVDGDFYHSECFSDAAENILLEQVWVTKGVAEVDR